jgi:hypothetical protein
MPTLIAEQERRKNALQSVEAAVYGDTTPEPGTSNSAADQTAGETESPAATATKRSEIEEAHQRRYQTFLTEQAAALDGLTPLAAAQDPAKRPALVELMKHHIHSVETRNRREGLNLRLDGVLEELGLRELL